jgi:hypothetical protein
VINNFFDWLQQSALPWVTDASGWFFVLCLVQLPLLLFRRTRRWVGETCYGVSFLFGFDFWLLCLVITHQTLGLGWMMFGTFMGGIGVVPLAFVGVAIRREWSAMLPLFLLLVAVYALRGFGIWIQHRCDNQAISSEIPTEEISSTQV